MQNFSTADRKGLLKATVISLKEKKKNTTAPRLNKKKKPKTATVPWSRSASL